MGSAVQKALVVGGGVAGITLALGLKKQGVETEIVEISSKWTIPGLGIALLAPTLRALKTVGLLDACMQAGFGYSAIRNFNADGTPIGDVELPRLCGPNYPAALGILRREFHNILLSAAEAVGLPIWLGVTVRAIRRMDAAAEVEFNTGAINRYDLVVGADGAHSKIRSLLFGPEVLPRMTGQTIWRATVERPRDVDSLWQFFGPRQKAGFNPVSHSQMYVYVVQNGSAQRTNLAKFLRDELADFGGAMAVAREAIVSDDQVISRPAEALILKEPWHRDRVILIGDAAHTTPPHLASGAGIAIEDSIVLAELLGSGLGLTEALRQFNARRYERCRMVVENSLQLGEWEKDPKSPRAPYVTLMDESMRSLARPI
jgi:2-polyprenyl-6-methoxyphenol hydroxylase-like FAD-dependent oxidoreductase